MSSPERLTEHDVLTKAAAESLDRHTKMVQDAIEAHCGLKRGEVIWLLVADETLGRVRGRPLEQLHLAREVQRKLRPGLIAAAGYACGRLRHTPVPPLACEAFYRAVTFSEVGGAYSIAKEQS